MGSELSTGKRQAIDKIARQLRDEIMIGRRATFQASDAQFRADVLVRLKQLLAGEEQRWEDADD